MFAHNTSRLAPAIVKLSNDPGGVPAPSCVGLINYRTTIATVARKSVRHASTQLAEASITAIIAPRSSGSEPP